ncbi:hypothetical protein H5410_060382 [Solanum commersonii]|uniref:Gag-pol polyprotein n=1 Tax=Solanum commersonii TaxID=4109 RepID=A0A9J5W5V8_SOLCO|nr:hypothetical protein H5410_060382 [Solanum commersonii]
MKQEIISVQEYNFKFTELSRDASEMVADMRSRMSLFMFGRSHLSNKKGKAAMLLGEMDIIMLMIHRQQVEEDKLKDREEFQNKKAKTAKISSRHASSSASGPAPSNSIDHQNQNFRAQATQSHGSVVQGATWTAANAKCGRNHLGFCCDDSNGCFKCGMTGYFMRYSPKNMLGNGENIVQSSSTAPTNRADPRG